MSYSGKSVNADFLQLKPLAVDPANPVEGDLFYSDGTPRDEGPWIWTSGAWAQISTGANLSTLPNLTLTPQAADPGTPATGMLFYADGTSRNEGLWIYNGTDWEQLTGDDALTYLIKPYVTVRLASTANVNIASQLEAGDTLDGNTLVAGNLVLLKNQTTASENGVYVVQVSGPALRDTSADTFEKLNEYSARIINGAVNGPSVWFQTNTLTSLSDSQNWSSTPKIYTTTVPENKYTMEIMAYGGGGGGGAGGRGGAIIGGNGNGGGGGAGGNGSAPQLVSIPVTPNNSLSIQVGSGGLGGFGGINSTVNSQDGRDSSVTTPDVVITFQGGARGLNSISNSRTGGPETAAVASSEALLSKGGKGGTGALSGSGGTNGEQGGKSLFIRTLAAAGVGSGSGGGGGGAGGNSYGIGGAGGNGLNETQGLPGGDGGLGAGGGGGGGSEDSTTNRPGGDGGTGGHGQIRIRFK